MNRSLAKHPDRRLHQPAAVTAVALVAFACGCGARAPQVEFGNLRHSAALRTAANTRSRDRLERAAEVIEGERAAGRIGPEEYAAYAEIIATARGGDWQAAERAAMRFRRDQTRSN
ncbi:MAG: hypothetical protein FJ286_16910 [Planctomycetes bacterium]|nr:hypothetical protein [Planctomycetota bacterium]